MHSDKHEPEVLDAEFVVVRPADQPTYSPGRVGKTRDDVITEILDRLGMVASLLFVVAALAVLAGWIVDSGLWTRGAG